MANLETKLRIPKPLMKTVSAAMITAMLGIGFTPKKAYADETTGKSTTLVYTSLPDSKRDLSSLVFESTPKKLNLDVSKAYEQAYESYLKQGIELAGNAATRTEAIDAFTKAIKMAPEKTKTELMTLDEKVKPLYMQAMQKAEAQETKEEVKKKKSIVPWLIGGAAAIGLGYLVYTLTKKDEPTPQPKDVTITLDAYNSTEGFKTDLTAKTVKEGSAVAIKISDTGVTGIDTKYIAVYTEDFKKKIAFDNDGEANFTAPTTDVKYHVIMFDELGINSLGQQVSYDWISDAKLQNGKRNHVVYRRDFDGQTGPEKVWGGEYISAINANGVFDQLNDALVTNYTTWGHVDRQPTATSGDFSYGFGNCGGADGVHAGTWIAINPTKLYNDVQGMVAVGLEEAWENSIGEDDIGGIESLMTIQHQGVLKEDGKRLLLFAYIKDDASFTSSTTSAAVMSAAVNTIDVDKKIGPVEFGLNSGMLHAGFNNDRLSARTSLRMNGSGIESRTEAAIRMNQFQAGVSMIRSPLQEFYSAQGAFTIDRIILGANGGYDVKSRASSIGLSAIAPLSKGDGRRLMLGYNQSNDRNGQYKGLSVAASTRINNNSGVVLSGNYSRQDGLLKAEALSIGASADVDIEKVGRLMLTASHAINNYALQRNKSTTLDLAFQPKIPGMLYFRVVDMDGMARDYQVGCTLTLKIK